MLGNRCSVGGGGAEFNPSPEPSSRKGEGGVSATCSRCDRALTHLMRLGHSRLFLEDERAGASCAPRPTPPYSSLPSTNGRR